MLLLLGSLAAPSLPDLLATASLPVLVLALIVLDKCKAYFYVRAFRHVVLAFIEITPGSRWKYSSGSSSYFNIRTRGLTLVVCPPTDTAVLERSVC